MRTTVKLVRCDGCGAEARIESPTRTKIPDGWRRVVLFWRLPGSTTTRSAYYDVCTDSLCAARVLDLNRDSDRQRLSVVR